jgi:hypothetical protein
MTDSTLVDRLTAAAAAALEDLAPTLEHELPKLKGVVIELETANNGQVAEATAWVERKARIRRLTG